jgi:murein DD-endopeptidase MepM/ murein hydrolase activator NlpD
MTDTPLQILKLNVCSRPRIRRRIGGLAIIAAAVVVLGAPSIAAQPMAATSAAVVGYIKDASPPGKIEIEITTPNGASKPVKVGADITMGSTLSIAKWCGTPPSNVGYVVVETRAAGEVKLYCGANPVHAFHDVSPAMTIPMPWPASRYTKPAITSMRDDPGNLSEEFAKAIDPVPTSATTPAPAPATEVKDTTHSSPISVAAVRPAANPGEPSAATTHSTFFSAATPATPGTLNGGLDLTRPVSGKVIVSFGGPDNSSGIEIAAAENTPVVAADDGEVIYAGDDVTRFGNLVLLRHPNGYVTAYGFLKELMVKRGAQVKRGQVIAKSGRNKAGVQELYFELRNGSMTLDPSPYLAAQPLTEHTLGTR